MILRRIRETADAAIMAAPDILVIIDSPDFTHRVARQVRARAPAIPIVDYVAPTVWAWRSGRARAMRRYIDHVLALLPFEPEAYRRLKGPPCTYIGHTLIEQIGSLRPDPDEQRRRDGKPPVLLVLPGSRRSEIRHHMAVFGETLRLLREQGADFELVLPTMPHLLDAVREGVANWPVQPRIAVGEQEKKAAFRIARAAFAKSGTVTLELALAGVPMIGAYRAGPIEMWIALTLAKTSSVILANLVIGENVVPEFMQAECNAREACACVTRCSRGHPATAAPARSVFAARRHHGDRRQAAERASRRHRARDAAEIAETGLSCKKKRALSLPSVCLNEITMQLMLRPGHGSDDGA